MLYFLLHFRRSPIKSGAGSCFSGITLNSEAKDAFKNPQGFNGTTPSTALLKASICAGVVPQHPPKKLTPFMFKNSFVMLKTLLVA